MTPNSERVRQVVDQIVQDEERWRNFATNPSEVLRAEHIDLQELEVSVYQLPDHLLELFPPQCPDGWEPRLVYETKCVCVEWVEIKTWDPNLDSSFPPKAPSDPPSGAWVPGGIICRRKELRRTRTWVCEKKTGWPCQ